ncbi:unnamed protein product [Blepharisma stoltei]|uniref:Uncharacterized protein n=1 Tax=Blepharisma stoltei TaxID=1481888 RepID=A0AAU9IW63_9CILI|nr:unnamed protein product [Blepharisma stoltei]
MLKGNNRIYLLERNRSIFESAENSILSWSHIGTNSIPAEYYQSSFVLYKKCYYIVDYGNKLWKFDLTSKQASYINTV